MAPPISPSQPIPHQGNKTQTPPPENPQLEEYKDPNRASPSLDPSRAQVLKPKVRDSGLLFDDRDTRSTLCHTGPMTVEHFDEATGMLTARFDSIESYQRVNQLMADRMAAYSIYAGARRMAGKAGSMESIPTRAWLEKALLATAEQVKDEKHGEIAAHYWSQASGVAATREKGEKEFEERILKLKKAFLSDPPNFDTFFEDFEEAHRLNPKSFEPFYFMLIYSSNIAGVDPQIFEKIVKDAYNISPIRTFNCLMIYLSFINMREPKPTDQRAEHILPIFQEQFSSDVALAMTIHDFTTRTQKAIVENSEELVTELRNQFSHHLESGLNLVRARDLTSARDEFSKATYFHISDKRPYMYRALIDLSKGDPLSALKQITDLERTIRMNDKDHYRRAEDRFWKFFLDEKKTAIQLEAPSEASVLKSLLKIFRSDPVVPDALQNFYHAMVGYLQNESADPLWAQLAIDLASEHVGVLRTTSSSTEAEKKRVGIFMHLYGLVPSFLYLKLLSSEKNLTQFEDFFAQDAEGNLNISINLIMSSSSNNREPLQIDPMLFEISQETEEPFLRSLLMETYTQYGSLFLRVGGQLENWDEVILAKMPEDCGSMSPSFISALLDRYDEEGTAEQKTKLIQWACDHFPIYPESRRGDLTRYVLSWQLNQPIPCMGIDPLAEAANKWLQLVNFQFSSNLGVESTKEPEFASESNRPLGIAFQTWSLIHKGEFLKAADRLDLFFQNWDDFLSQEIDPAALRALCLARALLADRDFIQPRIFDSLSGRGLELAGEALSMIAREGVIMRYIIPTEKMPKEKAQKLYRLYLGQKRGESDLSYKKRLEASRILDPSNLREAKRFKDAEEEKRGDLDPSWVLPFLKLNSIKEVRGAVDERIKRNGLRRGKNRQIGNEKPAYIADPEFIDWVTETKDLISQYVREPQKIEGELNRKFPRFPGREDFIVELKKKAGHLESFQILTKKTPPPEKNPGRRFWQLINQTAQLIETVASSKRKEEDFDLFVMNKEEAEFVMQLIYEWGLDAWGDRDMTDYEEAFHGPETHIWGNGPRIPHFNAGVYIAGNREPINTHIFYPS